MDKMASSRKRVGEKKMARRPLTKTKLLPMSAALARERSLSYHVALDCWRRGHGNGRIVNELTRATYMAWFLQCAGYGGKPVELFKAAECVGEITLMQAHESGRQDGWSLDDDCVSTFTALLALHDAQLRTAPLHQYEGAERRLLAFLQGPERSPIPAPID
ncbi:hypothetical protein [Paraburkholderia sp. BL17N1]|uniref:hypothetical protein n=1 Tax=Paraburkholderia sp. BL17N1 TaxID=1938798 RepID=UPI001F544F10|nr:hypothetical protein [Paraburkholderia sp. BL17N1]